MGSSKLQCRLWGLSLGYLCDNFSIIRTAKGGGPVFWRVTQIQILAQGRALGRSSQGQSWQMLSTLNPWLAGDLELGMFPFMLTVLKGYSNSVLEIPMKDC